MAGSLTESSQFLRPGRLIFWTTVLVMALYAFLVEPVWMEVTHHHVGSGATGGRMRVAQLSDLHLQNIGSTEQNTLDTVREIAPDVILLTGDVVDRPDALPVLDA